MIDNGKTAQRPRSISARGWLRTTVGYDRRAWKNGWTAFLQDLGNGLDFGARVSMICEDAAREPDGASALRRADDQRNNLWEDFYVNPGWPSCCDRRILFSAAFSEYIYSREAKAFGTWSVLGRAIRCEAEAAVLNSRGRRGHPRHGHRRVASTPCN